MTGPAVKAADRAGDGPGDAAPAVRFSVRARIISALLAVVFVALCGAGVIVYLIERDRVEDEVAADVEQELAELEALRATGINPTTQQPFASAREVVQTFMTRNVAGSSEVLVGWWDGRARVRTPASQTLSADLRPTSALHRALAPLADEGRSGRLDLPGTGQVLVTVQPVDRDGERASLVVLTFMDPASAGLRDTMRTYTVVSLAALVVIGVAATWQSGRLLAPLRDLRRTADRVTARDLTERLPVRGNDDITALTRTFNGMLDRLDTSFTSQRQFLDDAGHELRTPLTVLRGHLELMDPEDPAEVAATRALLLDEVDRMGRLTDDLILLAKARRPDFVRSHPVDVGDLTRTVLAKARGMADRDWQCDEVADVLVLTDEQRLTQALLQLLDNAVKHTDPGSVVAVGSAVRGTDLELWVRDTGDGVPVPDRDAVFGRFNRSHVREGDEGFGLGLSVVHAIAVALGGTVRVTDPPAPHPPGARFVLTLSTSTDPHVEG